MKPTHYYTFLRGKKEYKKFVTLESKNGRLTTSSGVWADTIEDLKSIEELYNCIVEYQGATGLIMEALSGDNDRPNGTYAYTTLSGFRVYLGDRVCNNEMVRVSWSTLTSQKTLPPTWVPFNKLTIIWKLYSKGRFIRLISEKRLQPFSLTKPLVFRELIIPAKTEIHYCGSIVTGHLYIANDTHIVT